MDEIKVLWFTNTPSLAISKLNKTIFGGGWIMSLEKAIKENAENVKVSVVFNSDEDKEYEIDGAKYYSVSSLDVNRIKKKLFIKKYEHDNDEYQLKKYLKIIEDAKPDVIHIHGSEKNYGLISKYVDIPVVMSIQGLLSVYQYKFFSGIDVVRQAKIKIPGKLYKYYESYKLRGSRELKMIGDIDYFFGRTFWDKAITRLISPRSQYFVVNRVIRDHFYNIKWKGIRDNTKPIRIVTTIRDNVYKGFETVLESARILKEKKIKFEWKIAGSSNKSFLINMYANEFNEVKDCVELVGSLNEKDLSSLLCESDMYVQSSRIENSPNGLAEAMLIGMPCIATNVGGTGSYISQYKDGILIQDGDPWIMASTIYELISNEELALNLGANATITAKERHDPNNVVQAISAAYREIVDHYNRDEKDQ